MKPRKDWTSLTFVGVSHSVTLQTFVRSMVTWSFEMTSPRYLTSFCSNLHFSGLCHNLQCSRACRTYFPWPWTRRIDPGSILVEQCTMPDEATKVGMQNTDTHICVPSLFSSQCVYIYPTSTGNFPSLEIN